MYCRGTEVARHEERLTMTNKRNEQRLWLWAMLLSSVTGTTIGVSRALAVIPITEWPARTVAIFSYFTTMTNTIVIIMAAVLLYGSGRLRNWFQSPSVQAACCLYIAFVGVGYWGLLGPSRLDTALAWLHELTVHSLSPVLGAGYLIRVVQVEQLRWYLPLTWLIYPIGYLVYWLFRGPIVGYYPYFFVDVNAIGYAGVAQWSAALIVGFLLLAWLLLWISGRMQRSSRAVTGRHSAN